MVQTLTQRAALALSATALLAAAVMTTACAPKAQNSVVSAATNGNAVVNGTDATQADVSKNGLAESVVIIVGQKAAPAPEKGFMVFTCTGTLIAPRIVLTAAHCVSDGLTPADMTVGLHFTRAMQEGEDDQKENPLASGYRVQSFTINPGYSQAGLGKQQNDLALMLLEKAVPAGTRLATLPEATLNVDDLEGVLAIGYGMSNEKHNAEDSKSGAGVLRYTTWTNGTFGILDAQPERKSPFDGMIASMANKTSVCHGDSGGPLMMVKGTSSTNIIVGINDAVLPHYSGQQQTDYEAAETAGDMDPFFTKYPDANICSGGLNVFVNVAAQLPWINSTMASLVSQVAVPKFPAQAQGGPRR